MINLGPFSEFMKPIKIVETPRPYRIVSLLFSNSLHSLFLPSKSNPEHFLCIIYYLRQYIGPCIHPLLLWSLLLWFEADLHGLQHTAPLQPIDSHHKSALHHKPSSAASTGLSERIYPWHLGLYDSQLHVWCLKTSWVSLWLEVVVET